MRKADLQAKPLRGHWETVRDRAGECSCDWCGTPLYIGDKLWELDDFSRYYCSKSCANKDEATQPAAEYRSLLKAYSNRALS